MWKQVGKIWFGSEQSEVKETEKDKFKKAIEDGNTEQVRVLLDSTPTLINEIFDCYGQTVLHLAAEKGYAQVVELLLSKMSQQAINAVNKYGSTALHEVARSDHYEIAVLLLPKMSRQAINAGNKYGSTALHEAARSGRDEIAALLLQNMKQRAIDAVNKYGSTALHLAASNGHEKVAELLLPKMKQQAIDAVDQKGNTILHLAASNGHENIVKLLLKTSQKLTYAVNKDECTVMHEAARNGHEKIADLLSLRMSSELIDAVNHGTAVNATELQLAVEDKRFHYPPEKIDKLLKVQLQGKEDIMINVLDLAGEPISEQQVQHFIKLVMEQDKTLAIALHLHGEAWASLVLKQQGDNLQLIYNDPTGNAFAKESAVQTLINSIMEHCNEGGTNITDLKQLQQNVEADSEAVVVDSLVKLATAQSFKKADLQQLLPKAEEVSELKSKHLLIEETNLSYSGYKLKKILDIALKDQSITVTPVTELREKESMRQNIEVAMREVINSGKSAIVPLHMQGSHWSGLVIKKQVDSSLQIIYSNPKGNKLVLEEKAGALIKAIMQSSPEVHIIDIMHQQDNSEQASGVFTIDNLVKLATTDTSNFHQADFQALLAAQTDIDQLRREHVQLLHDAGIPVAMPDFEQAGEAVSVGHDASELKGDHPDGKAEQSEHQEDAASLPKRDQEEAGELVEWGSGLVQVHVVGGVEESGTD